VNTVNLLRDESTEKNVYSMRGDRKWRKDRKCLSKENKRK
jgi:hypothetical protein